LKCWCLSYVGIPPTPPLAPSTHDVSNDLGYITSVPVTSVSGKTGAVTLVKSDVGLGDVDNTSDINKPISTATQTALNTKEPTIATGTITQYWRGDKTWQTLPIGWSVIGNSGTVATTNFIGTTDNVDFVLRTNNTEKMRVTSSGNVGIGTTTPTSTLQVNGSISTPITQTATSLTLTSAHQTIVVSNAAVAVTITLPLASTCTGRIYTIARGSGSTGAITLSGTSIQSLTVGLMALLQRLVGLALTLAGPHFRAMEQTGYTFDK